MPLQVHMNSHHTNGDGSCSSTSSANGYRWNSSSARRMADCIHNEVRQMVGTSRLVRNSNDIALVNRDDLHVGALLGKGAFSEVHEVCFKRRRAEQDVHATDGSSSQPPQERFAMKHLKCKLMAQPDNFRLAAAELAVEAHMLASFDHPNILKIRGWAANGVASFVQGTHDSFFLLLDCLEETLDERIVQWKSDAEFLARQQERTRQAAQLQQSHQQQHHLSSSLMDMWRRFSSSASNLMQGSEDNNSTITNNNNGCQASVDIPMSAEQHQLLLEKYQVCAEIASALSYLHEECGVIFRDLKPNNIGFGCDGRVKLFDFGLSRELPQASLTEPFEMSGKVGTLRYMAVEVAAHQAYNVSADVYSWAMVCYEIFTHLKPFAGWTREMHADYVCARAMRPEFQDLASPVPPPMQHLLQLCWDQVPQNRPALSQVYPQVLYLQEQERSLVYQTPASHQVPADSAQHYHPQDPSHYLHQQQPQHPIPCIAQQPQSPYPQHAQQHPQGAVPGSPQAPISVELPDDFMSHKPSHGVPPRCTSETYTAATLSLSNESFMSNGYD